MMNINEEIKNMINDNGCRIEPDLRCSSSIMNSKMDIRDVIMSFDFVDEMEVYLWYIIREIANYNSPNVRIVTTNHFDLNTMRELKRITSTGHTPRIISISKKDNFDERESERLNKFLKSHFVEEQDNAFFVINSTNDPYPFDINRLKLYGMDAKLVDVDFVIINSDSFDIFIDRNLGSKKYLNDMIDAIVYHKKRLESSNAC